MRGEKRLLGNLCNKTIICFISLLVFQSFNTFSQTPLYADVSVNDNGTDYNLGSANTSRNVAIDINGNIYVVYANSNQIRIAKSTNNGQSFSPSVLVANTANAEPEIAVNDLGTVFVAWVDSTVINVSSSTDGGTNFNTPDTFGSSTRGRVHMTTYVNNVYLTDQEGVNIYYNNNNGIGPFIANPSGLTMVYADVLVNQNGLLYIPMDDPDLVLFQSINQGNTLTQTTLNPSGQVYFSSYALSDGPCGTFIFVGGGGSAALSETLGYRINAITGETSEITLGANSTSFEGRTLFADNKGTLIDGYRESNGDLMISVSSDQGNTFNTPIAVANGDSHNIARSPTTNNIVVVYERNGNIFLSVYDNIIKNIEIEEPDPALVFCSSSNFDLSFTLSGIFSPGTILSASLSDEFGDFSNSTEIGTITTNASGVISCTIPNGLTPSNNYRLQVESLAICLQSNSISISIGEGSINGDSEACSGDTIQLTNTGTPISINPWLSSNTNVATINNSGLVTTLNSGTTDITFTTDNGCSVTHTIEVFDAPTLNGDLSLDGCDSNADGIAGFNTSTLENNITNGQTGMTFFYTDENGNALPSPLPDPFNSISQTITVRVENTGLSSCSSEVTVDLIVFTSATLNLIPTQEMCDENFDGSAPFETSTLENTILNGQTGMTVSYTDANGNALSSPLPNPFNSISQTINVRVENEQSATCFTETTIEFIVREKPNLSTIPAFKLCDEDLNGTEDFNTTNLEDTILNGQTGMTVFYTDENGNALPSPLPNPFTSTSQTINVRVENEQATTCFSEITIDFIVSTNPVLTTIPPQEMCDEDFDGIASFNTSTIETTLLNGQTGMTVFYTDENGNALPSPLPNPFNSETQTINVRVENEQATTCFSETTINFIVNEKPTVQLDTDTFICMTDSPSKDISVINPNTSYTYTWTDEIGNQIGTGTTINVTTGGLFNVTATILNCISDEAQINVIESNIPVLTIDNITINENLQNNSITIDTSNFLPGNYEFSLVDSNFNTVYNYQDEPFFGNVNFGLYTILVRDKNNCGGDEVRVSILNFPNFFTPNEDNINDFWTIEGFNSSFYPSSNIFIYNRYGKMMAQLPAENPSWDGSYNGIKMPSTDYWYFVKLIDIYGRLSEEKGHFSLLRR